MSDASPASSSGEDADGEAFLVEPVIGWRCWNLVATPEGPLLLPAGLGRGIWPAREPFRAACRSSPGYPSRAPEQRAHRAPHPDCTCGIYASTSLRALVKGSPAFPQVSVVGQVAMWGRIMEHERGWRSEFAYPQRLAMVCAVCAHVGRRSGDPVVVASSRPGLSEGFVLTAVCAAHHESPMAGSERPFLASDDVLASLLDRYAIDRLPAEAVRPLFGGGARGQRTRITASSPSPKRAATPRPVLRSTIKVPLSTRLLGVVTTAGRVIGTLLLWAFFVIIGLRSCVVTVDTSEGSQARAPAVPGTITGDEAIVASYQAVPPPSPPSPPVRQSQGLDGFRALCGLSHGGWVEYVECGSQPADVFGIAQSPPAPCRDRDAITRGRGFSVCWLFLPGEGSVELDPRPQLRGADLSAWSKELG